MCGKQTWFVSNSTRWQRGYGALALASPIINTRKMLLRILLLPLLSQPFLDRLSSRWTFDRQSTNPSNFTWTYHPATSFLLGEGHGTPGEWGWWGWGHYLEWKLRCVSDLLLEELDGADTCDKGTHLVDRRCAVVLHCHVQDCFINIVIPLSCYETNWMSPSTCILCLCLRTACVRRHR